MESHPLTLEQRTKIGIVQELLDVLTEEIAIDSCEEGRVLWDCYIKISSIVL